MIKLKKSNLYLVKCLHELKIIGNNYPLTERGIMKVKNLLLLLLLSAIWGGSFIFMRILSPVFGAVGTACLRALIAGVFLLIYFTFTKYKINWKRDWRFLLVIGIINSAIPFFCYSFAALYIPASLSVIINSMSPMFGAVFATAILKEKLTITKGFGLLFGTFGVALITGSKSAKSGVFVYLAIAACLIATICYGFSGAIIKKYAKGIEAKAMAGGSQFFAGLALLPFLIVGGTKSDINFQIAIIAVVFAVLCSAIAYLIYYHLMKEIGPTKTLTVTFIMPVFGILWGFIFLNEKLIPQMLIGGIIILLGTFLVVRPEMRPKSQPELILK